MYVVLDPVDLGVVLAFSLILLWYIRDKMSAIENLNAAVSSLKQAHGNLFTHVQLHVSQSASKIAGAGAANEAAIQQIADQVNGIVNDVNAEISKIPVTANV